MLEINDLINALTSKTVCIPTSAHLLTKYTQDTLVDMIRLRDPIDCEQL